MLKNQNRLPSGAFVINLLEYFHQQLSGAKNALAKQLLTKPWNTDVECLREHLPIAVYKTFCILRKHVSSRLEHIQNKTVPLFHVGVQAVEMGVHAELPDGQSGFVEGNDRVWADHIWAQVVEDLEQENISSQSLTKADRAAFVALYSVAHTCLFVMAGVVVPCGDDQRQVKFERNSAILKAHKLYWFAHYWAHQSTLSDHALILGFLEKTQKTNNAFHDIVRSDGHEFNLLCNYFIDKFLSLHPDYMALMHAKDRVVMQDITERLRLILYIYLHSTKQQVSSDITASELLLNSMLPAYVREEYLNKAGFPTEAIKSLLDDSRQHPVGDRFIENVGDGQLQVGNLSLKYALRKYCHAGLSTMNFRGDWFERDYIANYVRDRIPSKRYRVFPGINDKSAKYDADVIIEDTRSHTLLFCQIKHRTATLLPHLRDELKEYSSNGQILHGLEQLRNLRNQIREPGVLERVRQRIGERQLDSEMLAQRAGFLLIHNIENLDFCTSEGVAMYEWNTLRNLMKGQIGQVTKETATAVSISDIELDLRTPCQVMEAMLDWFNQQAYADHPTSPRHQWPLLLSSNLVFRVWCRLWVKAINFAPAGKLDFCFPLI